MNRTTTLLCLLPLACVVLSGCESGMSSSKGSVDGRTLHSDSTTSMTARVGEVVELGLPGNAGTGFTWTIVGELPDCLKKVAEPYFKADHPELPGSSGTTRFRLEAVEAGSGSIRFEYARPWDKDAPPARWSVVDITVGG